MNMDNLIELRKDLGLTQEEMGKIIGVKRSTYGNYESRYLIIPIKKINIISNEYSKSLNFLLGIDRSNDDNFKHIDINFKKIGERLRKIRLSMNLTEQDFGELLNAGESSISDYELGKCEIPTAILIEYSKISKKSIDWLCCKK